jgi:hypothetical protein
MGRVIAPMIAVEMGFVKMVLASVALDSLETPVQVQLTVLQASTQVY